MGVEPSGTDGIRIPTCFFIEAIYIKVSIFWKTSVWWIRIEAEISDFSEITKIRLYDSSKWMYIYLHVQNQYPLYYIGSCPLIQTTLACWCYLCTLLIYIACAKRAVFFTTWTFSKYQIHMIYCPIMKWYDRAKIMNCCYSACTLLGPISVSLWWFNIQAQMSLILIILWKSFLSHGHMETLFCMVPNRPFQ